MTMRLVFSMCVLLAILCTVAAKPREKFADKKKWGKAFDKATDKLNDKMEKDLELEGIPPKEEGSSNGQGSNGKREASIEYKRMRGIMDELMKTIKERNLQDEAATDVDQMVEPDVAEEKTVNKRMSETTIYSLGANPDLLLEDARLYSHTPREDIFREGTASDTDTCTEIRGVPADLRDPLLFFDPIHESYTKYTETYGIPIIGSDDVTHEGLARACYEVKFMLASRYDIRNAFYKLYGRIALIGDNEEQTSLYEYSTWNAEYWNNRVRGLGPTLSIPVTSAGDDNQRCKPSDRYAKEDILLHEFAHGIHTMAAIHTIPGFQRRLWNAYKTAMNQGKYETKYAATNLNEYFAVGAQIYFDSYDRTDYKYTNVEGVEVPITNRDALREYDEALVDLLDEVFPCNNKFVHRCTWKDCTIDNYKLIYSRDVVTAKSQCTVMKSHFNKNNASECAEYTCYHLGNAFNYKKTSRASYCYVLHCDDPDNLQITQGSGAFDVYKIKQTPQMDFTAEATQPMESHCSINSNKVYVTPEIEKSKRCSIPLADRIPYGPNAAQADKKVCKARGGCYNIDHGCYYPTQECVNHSVYCPDWANYVDASGRDECTRNPAFMLTVCPLSCNACKYSYRLEDTVAIAEEMCQDEFASECQDLPCSTYKSICNLSCGLCEVPADWKEQLGIPDFVSEPIVL